MNSDPLEFLFNQTTSSADFAIYQDSQLSIFKETLSDIDNISLNITASKDPYTSSTKGIRLNSYKHIRLSVAPKALRQFIERCDSKLEYNLVQDWDDIDSETGVRINIDKLGPFNPEWCVTVCGYSDAIVEKIIECFIECDRFNTFDDIPYEVTIFISKGLRYNIMHNHRGMVNGDAVSLNIRSPNGLMPNYICQFSSSDMYVLIQYLMNSISITFDGFEACKKASSSDDYFIHQSSSIDPSILSLPDCINDGDANGFSDTIDSDISNYKIRKTVPNFKILQLPKKEVSFLIGKKGTRIEDIRTQSGATIKIVPFDALRNRNLKLYNLNSVFQDIRIEGNLKEINNAIRLIESQVLCYRSSSGRIY